MKIDFHLRSIYFQLVGISGSEVNVGRDMTPEAMKRERAENLKRNQALIRELRAQGYRTIEIANKLKCAPSSIRYAEKRDPSAITKQEPISR